MGAGGGTNLPDDFLEPNDTPNLASNLGTLTSLQTTTNLTIDRHANEIISKVVNFIEGNLREGGIQDYEVERVHL